MSTPRRIRRNTKPLEVLKAAAIIIGLLIGCILILWLVTPLLRSNKPEPELSPPPGKAM